MGAAGAAVATTIGNILASIYYLWYFLKKSKCFSISIKYFTCKDGILSGVCDQQHFVGCFMEENQKTD